ncbi:MAG: YqgE/AlgH family protein [Microthrixaceae bacterium]
MSSSDQGSRVTLLVSAPDLGDENFDQTVVLILEHDAEGALGLILNRPTSSKVSDHLPDVVDLAISPALFFLGGPVSVGSLLAIGRRQLGASSQNLRSLIGPLVIIDTAALVAGEVEGVDALRLFTGYSGWSAGQLDAELASGAWHMVTPLPDDVLCVEPEGLWRSIMRRQGGRLASQALYPEDLSSN